MRNKFLGVFLGFVFAFVTFFNVSEVKGLTATRYFGSSWFFELKNNGTLIIKPKNTPRTYDGLHQDFYGKSDWDTIWKSGPSSTAEDIRPYVKKVVFEANNGVKWSFNGFKADGMFEGFENVTEYSFAGIDASEAVSLKNFFKNNKALENLDLWRFGKMPKIINMDGFIEGCSNLTSLSLNNLDNSNIGPTNSRHSIVEWEPGYVSEDVARTIGAKEYGREIFGKGVYDIPAAFPKLKKISANNSKVWLVKNSKGLPGAEYYIGAGDSDILYLFKTKTTLTPEGASSVEIDSKRDYVDLITDRDGNHNHTINPATSDMPDKGKNINMSGSDLNPNGAGFLAPGVYEISKDSWEEEKIELPKTYYRIAYIGDVPFKIEGDLGEPEISGGNKKYSIGDDLILVQSENYAWLNTTNKSNWPTSGNYTVNLNKPIKFIYEDAAIDVNGKKHNVAITINKITFKDLEKIPTWTGHEREHDGNKYIDRNPVGVSSVNDPNSWANNNNGEYYRTILQASRNDGVTLRNYVKVGEGNSKPGIDSDWQVLSGGSGTEVDFKIEIEGANDNTSFIFYGQDLDVAASQNWNRPSNDADYDNLPVANAIYGVGGESFVLGEGNKTSTVKFANHTGLKLVNGNTVITTGSDPDTSWSQFVVQADAKGSNYTWVSGIACTSYALKNTPKLSLGEIEFEPVAKVLDGRELQAGEFEFTLTPDSSVSDNKATGSPVSVTNDASGNITFGKFKFSDPKVTIDGISYFPGTVDDVTNTHGEGTHISNTYAWTIEEKPGTDNLIKYDTDVKKLKIIISTPENDEEMLKGIKAEIYVDDALVKTVWSKDVKDNKYTADVLFKNVVLKEITLKNNWEDDDNLYGIRPEDLKGVISVKYDGKTEEVSTDPNGWAKEGNAWVYKFKVPVNSEITDWKEEIVPEGYSFNKESHEDGSDVYEMTNKIKKYDLTISKEVTGNIGDKNKEFKVTVKILNNNEVVTGTFKAIINNEEVDITSTDEGILLKLKHGDTVIIKNIKSGFNYEVEEEDTEYKEYFNVKSDNEVLVNTKEGNKYSGTLDSNQTITFTNNNEKIDDPVVAPEEYSKDAPKTGVNNSNKLFILLTIISTFGIYGFINLRKVLN